MRDDLAVVATDDLKGGTIADWLVTGWFTPDYRPLAEAFAANLSEHGAPFHLLAKPKLAPGWNTSRSLPWCWRRWTPTQARRRS